MASRSSPTTARRRSRCLIRPALVQAPSTRGSSRRCARRSRGCQASLSSCARRSLRSTCRVPRRSSASSARTAGPTKSALPASSAPTATRPWSARRSAFPMRAPSSPPWLAWSSRCLPTRARCCRARASATWCSADRDRRCSTASTTAACAAASRCRSPIAPPRAHPTCGSATAASSLRSCESLSAWRSRSDLSRGSGSSSALARISAAKVSCPSRWSATPAGAPTR